LSLKDVIFLKLIIISKRIILKKSPLNTIKKDPKKYKNSPTFFSPQKNKNPPKIYKKKTKNTKIPSKNTKRISNNTKIPPNKQK
jgi:hypothetical protein